MIADELFTNYWVPVRLREVSPFGSSTSPTNGKYTNNARAEQGNVAFDTWIAHGENLLSSCPRSHPGRPHLLLLLASEKTYRYDISRQTSDLDDNIFYLTEALLLPHSVVDGTRFKMVGALYLLSCAIVRRFQHTRQPPDLECGIQFFRYLLYLPLKEVGSQFSKVSAELANALSYRTERYPASEQENIEEVLTLFLGCLPWDHSEEYTAAVLSRLALAVTNRLLRTGQSERFEQVVGYLREGRKACRPKDHPELSVLLAFVLSWQSFHTGQDNDYEEIMALFNEHIPLLPPRHYMRSLAQMAMGSFTISQSESIEESINACRAALNCLPSGRQYRPMCLYVLASLLRERYKYFGNEECLREAELCANEAFSSYQSENLQSLRDSDSGPTSTILSLIHANSSMAGLEEEVRRSHERLADTRPDDDNHRHALLNSHLIHITKYAHSNDLTDLEKVIKSHQAILPSAPNAHRDTIDRASNLLLAFVRSGREELLDKSIDICRSVLETKPRRASRYRLFQVLGNALTIRCLQLGHSEGLNECISMFKAAFDEDYSSASERFEVACLWATVARHYRHPSTSLAYQNALSVMQSFLAVGPTVQTQHTIIGNLARNMRTPLEYASYQIESGQLELAVEILEQGRALLWSEMRALRTPVDQLRPIDPALADKFLAVSKALEAITTSISLHEDSETSLDSSQGHGKADAFSRTMKEQQRLWQERQAIISQIQALPGFENFLKVVPFHILRNAASGGPIVIINHCRWRCDIVIVLRDAPPSLIPTTREFYDHATTLATRLLEARKKYALESRQYNRVLRSVLEGLHELVGQPVIDRLRELRIPVQSRIWWCPTSVFCSLPLHAMGPIPSNDNQKRYFSDLYVSSYTPTLGALIASRTPVAQISSLSPSLLMVGQPDAYLQGVKGELEVIKSVGIPVTGLVSEDATREMVIQGLQKHRLAHFACHGNLGHGKPFDASFQLHDGDLLTLLDIVRSRLPIAEFAFLSACHTAELTDLENPDEALHLTAAMQYCGFRSVVGTMWAMADTDGRDLSAHFYRHMFSPEGEEGMSLCERSARALRDAVRTLRGKRGVTLERWVNFVHYGA